MNVDNTDRDQKIRDLAEKLRLVHEKYLARFAELKARQARLLNEVISRIDREQAEKILSSINGGSDKS